MSVLVRSDLLATCLRIAEAEDYIDVFEKHGIDTYSLKLLSRDDLEVLGITDKLKQDVFLDKISSLQIPSEEIKSTDIDQEYLQLVLYSMSTHLHKHLASLSCAVGRRDVVINDVQLTPSLNCLENCIESLRKECENLRKLTKKPETRGKKYALFGIAVGTVLIGSLLWLKLGKLK